ncbi:MAG TPA: hypothetical protein VEC38_14895 [Candidatus Binataceae bacterium]|nr:hypothetical protein [Candidatus Binataceae bacterium]
MSKATAIILCAGILLIAATARAGEVRIGVGTVGPITPQTETDLDRLVGALPNFHFVPIQPPADVDDAVKRFVAGEKDDRLDGIVVFKLPTDSFKTEQTATEAKFTGTYEIWTLNLSTLAEDRHPFTFTDSEMVVGGLTAIISIPAQLFVERASGQKLISGNTWQAYEAVQARVESKLIAGTKLYLSSASIRDTGPLNMLDCAQHLVDRGDGDMALAVFKAAGIDNPEVRQLMANAQAKLRRAHAEALLGRTLGAIAGGNSRGAATILAEYEKTPASEPARADSIRRILGANEDRSAENAARQVLKSDVPELDHAAFVAMVRQMFGDEAGSTPQEVIVATNDMTIQDKSAADGVKKHLDNYASALGKAAWLMSLKCGCEARASLTSDIAGSTIIKAHYAPSFTRAEVGIP